MKKQEKIFSQKLSNLKTKYSKIIQSQQNLNLKSQINQSQVMMEQVKLGKRLDLLLEKPNSEYPNMNRVLFDYLSKDKQYYQQKFKNLSQEMDDGELRRFLSSDIPNSIQIELSRDNQIDDEEAQLIQFFQKDQTSALEIIKILNIRKEIKEKLNEEDMLKYEKWIQDIKIKQREMQMDTTYEPKVINKIKPQQSYQFQIKDSKHRKQLLKKDIVVSPVKSFYKNIFVTNHQPNIDHANDLLSNNIKQFNLYDIDKKFELINQNKDIYLKSFNHKQLNKQLSQLQTYVPKKNMSVDDLNNHIKTPSITSKPQSRNYRIKQVYTPSIPLNQNIRLYDDIDEKFISSKKSKYSLNQVQQQIWTNLQ